MLLTVPCCIAYVQGEAAEIAQVGEFLPVFFFPAVTCRNGAGYNRTAMRNKFNIPDTRGFDFLLHFRCGPFPTC